MIEDITIDVQEASTLLGVSKRWVQKSIATGTLQNETITNTRGRGGITYRIPRGAERGQHLRHALALAP